MKIGDIVYLKSGSPAMVVNHKHNGFLWTTWIGEGKVEGLELPQEAFTAEPVRSSEANGWVVRRPDGSWPVEPTPNVCAVAMCLEGPTGSSRYIAREGCWMAAQYGMWIGSKPFIAAYIPRPSIPEFDAPSFTGPKAEKAP